MRIRKHAYWLIAAMIVYCAWAVSPALAHALLLRSTPESNAVLTQSPPQVELLFSEPLEPALSKIKVINTEGAAVDNGDSGVDSANTERMTVSLPPLADGVYLVSWQVVSQIDGHPTLGSFPFAVGNVNASSLPAEQQDTNSNLPISALIAKWLLLVSSALLAGQFISVVFVWGFTLHSEGEGTGISDPLLQAFDHLCWIGLFGILLACGLGILAQAGQTSGHELALPWAKETIQVLIETRLGVIWLTRIALTLIGIWLIRTRSAYWKQIARFIIGLALLLTISLTSHSATELHLALPVLNDWLHLVGMAFWFGGLAHLIIGLANLQKTDGQVRTHIVSQATKRFSLMALPSVAVVGVTGLFSAGLRVGTVAALFDTAYGHALLVKQVFVAVLLILAGINFLIISPHLRHDSGQNIPNSPFIQHFRKTVLLEVIFACVLLGSVSVMTYLPPAVTLPPQTTLSGAIKADDLKIALTISPGLAGQNDFVVKLTPQRSIGSVTDVSIDFEEYYGKFPPSDLQLIDHGHGVFTARGSNLVVAGRWLVGVTVRRDQKFDAIVTFDFTIPKSGSSGDKTSSPIPLISKSLIFLIALLMGLDLFPARRKQRI